MNTAVLVVGAGAAGLAAAATLGRYGIETVLVERRTEPSPLPRATVVSTRAMELLRSWTIADEVLAGGVDAEVLLWESGTLTAAAGRAVSVGYPTREQAAVVSPTAPAVVPQSHLETVLRRYVDTLPDVRVEPGTELLRVATLPDRMSATVRDGSGRTRDLRARFLVAADGARSGVRRALGVATRGRGEAMHGVQVLFHAPLWHLLGERRYALYAVTTPQASGLFLPAGPGDRWVYGLDWAPTEVPPELDPAGLVERIRRGAGVAELEPRIVHTGRFRSFSEMADRFRIGDAFLVGDAAHRVTPRGGTGMNTALQDGHDLGWKLAWVVQGWAGPELLDSYEAERRVVAEHAVTRSTDPYGSRRPVLDELAVDLGGRIRHLWLPGPRRTSTLGLLGPGWTVFTGPAGAAPTPAGRAPVAVRALDALTARALGIPRGGALVVRPDGVPASVHAGQPTIRPAAERAA